MWKTLFIASILAVSFAAPAVAKSDEIYTSVRNNLAMSGYDTVSFHQGAPLKGDDQFSTRWQGAKWQFSTRANLDTFMQGPQKYAPAYGGYCAWALAMDKLAKGSPQQWTIKDGVLYLNYNAKIKQRWLNDVDGFIVKANKIWPDILK